MSTPEEVHKLWLALVEKAGLVVAPPALVRGQAIAAENVIAEQRELLTLVGEWQPTKDGRPDPDADPVAMIPDLPAFTRELLEWSPRQLAEPPDSLAVSLLPAYHDELRPTLVAQDPADERPRLLVTMLPTGTPFDRPPEESDGWRASPHDRFERLLRGTEVPAGLLFNGTKLRLVYAPKGETSGFVTFDVGQMLEVGGRPMLAGLLSLLHGDCVFSRDKGRSLGEILHESRRYQATVSTALAGQVLGALHELLRGIQAADKAANGRILGSVVAEHRDHVYAGLVTVLMRLVFLLYAEDRELMPRDPVYAQHYSIVGLFDRLRADDAMYPDTMDQRYGAWAHLVSLFRLVHDGGKHAGLALPARQGDLFNPDSFPFLEGRQFGSHRVLDQNFDPPKVSDGVIWRVLRGLLIHDRERLSYRTLDVEQIGSVYEAIMGFGVERCANPVLALKPKNVFVDLAKLLAVPGEKRSAFLDAEAGCKLPPAAGAAVASAKGVDELASALSSRASEYAPTVLPAETLYLQPGEERRRSGSHYTPRELTSPIVATTLRPVLELLGATPTADQILGLKVCDPAMGSGAFLVETCRQLGEHLVTAWNVHGGMPDIPPDEEPYLHARRMIAQRCLYGVDRNPMAASLAKLSLWLVTLARDHAFTFLDHALKHGDSLVGYSRRQIFAFNPNVTGDVALAGPLFAGLVANLGKAKAERAFIQTAEEGREADVRDAFDDAERALTDARLKGDLLVAAFFGAEKPKERDGLRVEYGNLWSDGHLPGQAGLAAREGAEQVVTELRTGTRPVVPFHWEIEFPEVFDRDNPGFDAFVGNPPFAGKNTISRGNHPEYLPWLKVLNGTQEIADVVSNADLIAHFFRRVLSLVRIGGTFGFIATNTLSQGDTRRVGLSWISRNGGTIYAVRRRIAWPGAAAVIVSTVHIVKGAAVQPAEVDGRAVPFVSAFLLPVRIVGDPVPLLENIGGAFKGCELGSLGFLLQPEVSARFAEAKRPDGTPLVKEYLGGEDLNARAVLGSGRFAADVDGLDLTSVPEDLLKVLAEQLGVRSGTAEPRSGWWNFRRPSDRMRRVMRGGVPSLAVARVSDTLAFTRLPVSFLPNEKIVLFDATGSAALAVLQSRVHDVWARLLCATLKDDLQYAPSDCFETFPFPSDWQSDASIEAAGQAYYDHRAQLMIANNEGLTATYNRFHDKNHHSPGIVRLRELHAEMDRAVLIAYGWDDVPTACEFILDHEDPEDDEAGTPSRRRKPYRLRWPDAVRDDVLARLLDLNAKRAAAERAATPAAHPGGTKARGKKSAAASKEKAKAGVGKVAKPSGPPGSGAPAAPAGSLGPLFTQRKD